jgi:uncharacterized UBP type Zn finger protein
MTRGRRAWLVPTRPSLVILLGMAKKKPTSELCSHLDQIKDVVPSADGCEDCLKTGDSWVHLRLCLTCGHVGCCDQSKNKHATKHFHTTHHPIIKSIEPGEDWMWCYVDEVGLE